ncbi:MAG: pilin [bacterium]
MPNTITNPTGYSQLATQSLLLDNIVTTMVIGIGLLFLIYLIFGAFKYMTAGGDDKAVDTAKKMMTNAGVGITLAVGSFFIVDIVGEVLGFNAGTLTGILTPTIRGAPVGGIIQQYGLQILNPTGYANPGGGPQSSMVLGDLLNNVIGAVFIVGGILLLVYLFFGAFKYMTAGGDDKATDTAKKMMTNAVIGIVIMTVSFFIVRIAGTVLGMPNILQPTFPGP